MNGTTMTASAAVAQPGPSWHISGTGDFDGDDRSDILFQHDDGTLDIWTMNGTAMKGSAVVANPGPGWRAVGTGDFTGDGRSDIVLRNSDGGVAVWEMNGFNVVRNSFVAQPGPSWQVVDVGDFDGNGGSDIAFQHNDGTVDIWLMDGTTLGPSGVVANPGIYQSVLGVGGMNFINGTNTTGTLAATVLADNFNFASPVAGSHNIKGFNPLQDVVTLDHSRFGSFDAVLAHQKVAGGSTIIDLGNTSLTLTGVLPSALSARNFIT